MKFEIITIVTNPTYWIVPRKPTTRQLMKWAVNRLIHSGSECLCTDSNRQTMCRMCMSAGCRSSIDCYFTGTKLDAHDPNMRKQMMKQRQLWLRKEKRKQRSSKASKAAKDIK